VDVAVLDEGEVTVVEVLDAISNQNNINKYRSFN
jgi:radical SAM superfamily enzyme YgiQ (UPF0313 family)